jgi:muramoyltetrapeptide carboxypeptidase
MSGSPQSPRKPRALHKGSRLAVFSPASPAARQNILTGIAELQRLGFVVDVPAETSPDTFFAASHAERLKEFLALATNRDIAGLFAARGGYGANYLLDAHLSAQLQEPKCVMGFSDLTTLQIYLYQMTGWVTFYGPMIAAGFNLGPDASSGYDLHSFQQAVQNTAGGWEVPLKGEILAPGEAEGRILGGCLTLLQATLGAPWELHTEGTLLLLEDRAMKPYQVDRALMHLIHAGKFRSVRGVFLGDFPESAPPQPGSPTVREVCERILRPLGIPVVYGAPVGHTARPILTIPLGVRAKLKASGEGTLHILEPAVLA